jgi:hypothetical protein
VVELAQVYPVHTVYHYVTFALACYLDNAELSPYLLKKEDLEE